MSDNNKIEFATTIEATHAAEYLTRIAEGLLQGTINLTVGGRTITLQPSEFVKLEIQAESRTEKGKGSLAIEVSWKAPTETARDLLEVTAGPQATTETQGITTLEESGNH